MNGEPDQIVYCPRFPECHVMTVRHGKDERKPVKIAEGNFGAGASVIMKCHKCKHWVKVEIQPS